MHSSGFDDWLLQLVVGARGSEVEIHGQLSQPQAAGSLGEPLANTLPTPGAPEGCARAGSALSEAH